MQATVELMYRGIDLSDIALLQEYELGSLPQPVRDYLHLCNCIGKPKVKTARMRQVGQFNPNGKKWLAMNAEEYCNVDQAAFVWKAKAGVIHVLDQFVEQRGALIIKPFDKIKIAQATGPEMDRGEALRFLVETIWFPSAFINDYLRWIPIDDHTATAEIHYGAGITQATFHFCQDGKIEKITAERHAKIGRHYVLRGWVISNLDYQQVNGILIPTKAQVAWIDKEGDQQCYYKFDVTDIEYNTVDMY